MPVESANMTSVPLISFEVKLFHDPLWVGVRLYIHEYASTCKHLQAHASSYEYSATMFCV